MMNKTKFANFLAISLACVFVLCLFSSAFSSEVYGDTTSTDTEQTDITNEETEDVTDPTTVISVEKPPKFASSISAWKFAETKLYELSHWESIISNQDIDPGISIAGQTVRIVKVFDGKQNCSMSCSTILKPGKIFGMEFFEYTENKNGIVLHRKTTEQTSDRQPVWFDDGVTYSENEFAMLNGSLPLMPKFIISTSTTINGSSKPINDGSKITFSLVLKSSACISYIKQLQNTSSSTTIPVIEDGGIKIDVVLDAKNGYFKSIKMTERFSVTVKGVNATISSVGTEIFSKMKL